MTTAAAATTTDDKTATDAAAKAAADAAAKGADNGAAGGAEKGAAATTGWGDDWRQRMAANDDKALKRLERFNSPEDIFRSYRALEQRLSSGELKSALPKDAKPEEIAKWRAENGVPEAPDKYDLTFENGLVIGEADKPIIDAFLKDAHGVNMTTDQAKGAIKWYYSELERQAGEQAETDKRVTQEAQDALRGKWGNEYRGNMNRAHALLDTAPSGVKDKLLQGRLADGTPIGSSVEVLEFLAALAREINPVGTVVPGAGANMVSAIEDEIKAIEKTMRTDRKAYNKDEAMQARYRELLGARDSMKKKG